MGDRPEPIRLDDLGAPRFSAEAKEAMAAGAEMADLVELNPDRLLTEATSALGGLDDFGDDGWLEPLGVACHAYATEANLSRFGTVSMYAILLQFVKNRLLVTDLFKRYPEIDEQVIRAPMFIAGLPRTGTTHLHNLISSDPALRFMPYWEAIEPVPSPGEPLFGD